MAKTYQVPMFVRLGNVLTTTLLRAGFKLVGPGVVFGNYPRNHFSMNVARPFRIIATIAALQLANLRR